MADKVAFQGIDPVEVAAGTATPASAVSENRLMEFVEYPSTDGLPMADNNVQAHTMHHSDYALREYFGYGADVYIATDTFVYFQ